MNTDLVPFKADRQRLVNEKSSKRADEIEGIILHGTADDGNESGAEEWLCNLKKDKTGADVAPVSCHLLVRRSGETVRLVDDARAAWHAGKSADPVLGKDVNRNTLGIEVANREDGKEPWTNAQYESVAKILAHYLTQRPSLLVMPHAEVATPRGRKTDPVSLDMKYLMTLVNDLRTVKPKVSVVRKWLKVPVLVVKRIASRFQHGKE
jgi:N-acetyl-anhydromuramyl-L-alanine amidase AmpD